jgi:hypothetical protein
VITGIACSRPEVQRHRTGGARLAGGRMGRALATRWQTWFVPRSRVAQGSFGKREGLGGGRVLYRAWGQWQGVDKR